ncbi:MAG: isoprenylcysteine carboxylmethyltransferase family protein [Thermodesulfovibrionales bacterium]|nr:isoprenylcysteine carboxylmethyltransferase family protein [Thermodesulfovibrionales bacterium]
MLNFSDLVALLTIMVWPVVPLFWIPVHGLSKIFKRIGLITYILPLLLWPPLAFFIYLNKDYLLSLRIKIPEALIITGILLTALGTLLHLWTGKLLGLKGLIGIPEVSEKVKGRLVTEGPFSIVRHPTYIAHTVMFTGIFLFTGNLAVGILTLLDFLIVNLIIIPLEEKELKERFGEEFRSYSERVRNRFFPFTCRKYK